MPRTQTHEIVIDAAVEAVWKAITDGEELTRWFVEEAAVEPGVGGSFAISWGGPEKGTSRIEVWEPNRTLRVALTSLSSKLDSPIVDEYTIERRDGKTVLRLVSSGIPDAPEWDGFYNGTNSGWGSFLRTLRHYLEHHAGKPRTTIKFVGKASGTLADSWARITGPSGFGFEPIAGQPFTTQTGAGDTLHGDVIFAKAPAMLELSIRELGDALLAHAAAGSGPDPFVYTMLSLYGKSPAEVEAIRARWKPWLSEVLGLQG